MWSEKFTSSLRRVYIDVIYISVQPSFFCLIERETANVYTGQDRLFCISEQSCYTCTRFLSISVDMTQLVDRKGIRSEKNPLQQSPKVLLGAKGPALPGVISGK